LAVINTYSHGASSWLLPAPHVPNPCARWREENAMRLAKDTRQTLGLAVEALIELLDVIGPDPDAEPSLGATTAFDQEHAWDWDAGYLDDREHEHDGREPSEDEPHFYDEANKLSIHVAHEVAKLTLQALLNRLRAKVLAKAKLDATRS
jgi:hypothetical protein